MSDPEGKCHRTSPILDVLERSS